MFILITCSFQLYIHTHTHTHTNIHTYIHTCMHTYLRYTYSYTHGCQSIVYSLRSRLSFSPPLSFLLTSLYLPSSLPLSPLAFPPPLSSPNPPIYPSLLHFSPPFLLLSFLSPLMLGHAYTLTEVSSNDSPNTVFRCPGFFSPWVV